MPTTSFTFGSLSPVNSLHYALSEHVERWLEILKTYFGSNVPRLFSIAYNDGVALALMGAGSDVSRVYSHSACRGNIVA